VSAADFTLRRYLASDEDAAIDLWRRSWQAAYPDIDFAARIPWWRQRWRDELVGRAVIVIAEHANAMLGFVTVDTASGYLDQIVVAPEMRGSGTADALLAEAKRLSPGGLTLHVNQDNARAIRFYEKHGFVRAGEDINPVSGRPIYALRWAP
jgi:putative acetyltransferase